MNYEIEKKFLVGNFNDTLEKLKKDFGKYKYSEKQGFWWCTNYTGSDHVITATEPVISKKNITLIKEIGEINLPVQDFQFIRLRINNNKNYLVTFKNKSLVNNREQNIEYEYEVDPDVFKKITLYLNDTAIIFYYNIKKSWEFKIHDIKIEISKFNDLRDAYIEIETTGKNQNELNKKLDDILTSFSDYNLREENRNYVELSHYENKQVLKSMKLSQYSRTGLKILQDALSQMESE